MRLKSARFAWLALAIMPFAHVRADDPTPPEPTPTPLGFTGVFYDPDNNALVPGEGETIPTLDVGRHIAGRNVPVPIGSLVLTTQGIAPAEGEGPPPPIQYSTVGVSSTGFAQFGNGLRLTAASSQTLDAPGQSTTLQLAYNGPVGAYNTTLALPSATANRYTDGSGNVRNELGGSWTKQASYGNVFGQQQILNASSSKVAWYRHLGSSYPVYERELVETPHSELPPVISGSPANQELARGDAGAGVINERANPLLAAGGGESGGLDLSGVALHVTGTAVLDRTISGGTVDLGRRMVGSAAVTIDRTDNVGLHSYGTDDNYTRLTLGAFDLSGGAGGSNFTATLGSDAVFNSSTTPVSPVATVAVSGRFTQTATELGRNYAGFDVAGYITGEGLAGETVQSQLNVGYTWAVVDNNSLVSGNLVAFTWNDTPESRSYYNYSVGLEFSTETHTSLSWNSSVTVNGAWSAGIHDLGTTTLSAANGRVVGEGLEGEVVSATTSFQTRLVSIAHAATSIATTPLSTTGTLGDGSRITIADGGSGLYQAQTQIESVGISGADNLSFELGYSGSSPILEHGESQTFDVNFVKEVAPLSEGDLGLVFRADLTIGLSEWFSEYSILDSLSGFSYSEDAHDSYLTSSYRTYTWKLEHRIDAPAATTATATAAAGTDLGKTGFVLTNTVATEGGDAGNTSVRFATATSVELRDGTLTEEREIVVSFSKLDDEANQARVAALEDKNTNASSRAALFGGSGLTADEIAPVFTSDIVSLSGLDGIQHVIQITFDAESGSGLQQVVWEKVTVTGEGDDATTEIVWVNAVLGNSNISDLDLLAGTLTLGTETGVLIQSYLEAHFFGGSYDDYLASLGASQSAELGFWGYDRETSVAWAVIDHNSSFAVVSAIPEPSAWALVLGAVTIGFIILRRRA
ncbi:PEP-CTERM putative exosortase interaction domain-containing protein [Opitutaceae bacterium TAV1]|nr:PEP-CTERM putative exosortase interaction domain-containing protein [Opitutaceae bacterium TAV1]